MLFDLCQLRVEGFVGKKITSVPHMIPFKDLSQRVSWEVLCMEWARAPTLTMRESLSD